MGEADDSKETSIKVDEVKLEEMESQIDIEIKEDIDEQEMQESFSEKEVLQTDAETEDKEKPKDTEIKEEIVLQESSSQQEALPEVHKNLATKESRPWDKIDFDTKIKLDELEAELCQIKSQLAEEKTLHEETKIILEQE